MTVLTNFLQAGLAWNVDRQQRGAREFGRRLETSIGRVDTDSIEGRCGLRASQVGERYSRAGVSS